MKHLHIFHSCLAISAYIGKARQSGTNHALFLLHLLSKHKHWYIPTAFTKNNNLLGPEEAEQLL